MYADSSQQEVIGHWQALLQGSVTGGDFQLRRPFFPPAADDIDHSMWVNAQGFPFLEDGKPKFIMGVLTDVSHLK